MNTEKIAWEYAADLLHEETEGYLMYDPDSSQLMFVTWDYLKLLDMLDAWDMHLCFMN